MAKGKGKLKSALQSQQSRFKAKERAIHAFQVAQANEDNARGKRNKKIKLDPRSLVSSEKGPINGKGKAKAKSEEIPRRPTVPFRPTDTILLVGEGNFSFARALSACTGELEGTSSSTHPALASLAHLPAKNITATAYDSEEECYEKYPDAREIVEELRSKGVEVEFGVDAGKLEVLARGKGKGKSKELRKWDKVVWNFPHAGKGITDQDRNILSNQLLILSFLRSAAKVLKEGPVADVMAPSGKKRKRTDDDDDDDDDEEQASKDVIQSSSPSGYRGTVLIT
ncbi:hypothetical protein MPER_05664 [Moniliophthora perniciosa FA553]|nr:hypothetical protein MPER_05664 [Moniliophthora perniciosa FA553]